MKILLNNVVAFDIETEPFSEAFSNAQKDGRDTFDFVPRPRVCVCYDSLSGKYETYLPEDFQLLYAKLIRRKLLSFNGNAFDVNVILKHLNKNKDDSLSKKRNHYDLLALIKKETGKRYRLDDLVRANLGEKKHTNGRDMKDMDIVKLTEACRSDVDQTYRLMDVFLSGEMVYRYYRIPKDNSMNHDEEPHIVLQLDSDNLDNVMRFMKINEKLSNLKEAILNGHKYSEIDKINGLDDFLLEKTGKCFAEIASPDGVPLSFDERCKILFDLLTALNVQLPMDWLEECMTDGQLADYMTQNNY